LAQPVVHRNRAIGTKAGRFLAELREEVKARRFTPVPVREKMIPKANGTLRRLGLPTAADRVVQAALKLVLEPIFERISSHRRMASARGAVPRTRSPGDQVALCSCVFTTGAG
jgi:retron-type reverse transcriptase